MRLFKGKEIKPWDEAILGFNPKQELIQIMRERKQKLTIGFEHKQVKFLDKERKRLGWDSRASVVRGIVNMYMEEARAQALKNRGKAQQEEWGLGESQID